jgi:hypothetical protein
MMADSRRELATRAKMYECFFLDEWAACLVEGLFLAWIFFMTGGDEDERIAVGPRENGGMRAIAHL